MRKQFLTFLKHINFDQKGLCLVQSKQQVSK